MNVSIRVGSPGNDGPVSQANVAVAVSTGRVAAEVHVSTTIAAPPMTSAPETSLPALPQLPGFSSLPAVLAPLVPTAEPSTEGGGLASLVAGPLVPAFEHLVLPALDDSVGLQLLVPGLDGALLLWPDGAERFGPVARRDLRPGVWSGSGAHPSFAWSGANLAPVLAATHREVRPSRPTGGRPRAEPVPRGRSHVPAPRIPEPAPFGTSAAPATGGGSSGGGLPVLLALPFLAAMLDLARRVALERVALPSGHRSRMPDTPG